MWRRGINLFSGGPTKLSWLLNESIRIIKPGSKMFVSDVLYNTNQGTIGQEYKYTLPMSG